MKLLLTVLIFSFSLSSWAGNLSTVIGLSASSGSSSSEDIVYAFNTTVTYNGNLGGRAGADAKCLASKPAGLTECSTVKAFLTVDSGDQLYEFARLYGLNYRAAVDYVDQSNNRFVMLKHFSHFFRLAGSTAETGLTATAIWSGQVWTGSNANGTLSTTCQGWTDSTSGESGRCGLSSTNSLMIYKNTTYTCDQAYRLACMCW